MKRHIMLTFSLLAIATFIVGVLWRNQRMVQGQPRSNTPNAESDNPLTALNQRAKEAKSEDLSSIRALADEVFAATAVFQEIPPDAVEAMKDRLVHAEMGYRFGNAKQKNIEEIDVARMVNQLADTLSLPDYAKTCPLQVKHLRMSLLFYLPNFIGQEHFKEKPGGKRKVGSKMTSKMSPLEAAYVALVLLQQKKDNAAFQVTSQEWRAFVYKKKLDLWQAHREGRSIEADAGPTLSEKTNSNPKRDEIEQAGARGAAALPTSTLQNLPDTLLDRLGVARKEEQR
ncbi:MAG: hypothetical protein M3Y84_05840 [Acidobacteriota bacterium]|nr:hypothetical protein [Acidobacteriota bacterium]